MASSSASPSTEILLFRRDAFTQAGILVALLFVTVQMVGAEVYLEDLNSTNGTYVNGKAIKKKQLANADAIEIGKYKIKFHANDGQDYEKTMIMKQGAVPPPASYSHGFAQTSAPNSNFGALGQPVLPGTIKVLNGAAAGREVALTKVVTTVGKPGVQVASITKRPGGYVFAHVEGAARPTVNGNPLVGDTLHLKNGDVIELAGTQMQFVQT